MLVAYYHADLPELVEQGMTTNTEEFDGLCPVCRNPVNLDDDNVSKRNYAGTLASALLIINTIGEIGRTERAHQTNYGRNLGR